jgi:hypothetical protein
MYIVQTYRQKDAGDTIFLECVSKDGNVRLPIPPQVSDAIARQRDVLTGKSRSRAAKASAQARKAAGILPGFMRVGRKRKQGRKGKDVARLLAKVKEQAQ